MIYLKHLQLGLQKSLFLPRRLVYNNEAPIEEVTKTEKVDTKSIIRRIVDDALKTHELKRAVNPSVPIAQQQNKIVISKKTREFVDKIVADIQFKDSLRHLSH